VFGNNMCSKLASVACPSDGACRGPRGRVRQPGDSGRRASGDSKAATARR